MPSSYLACCCLVRRRSRGRSPERSRTANAIVRRPVAVSSTAQTVPFRGWSAADR